MPQSEPNAKMVSYSGPSLLLTLYAPPDTSLTLPHPIGHPQHAFFFIRYVSDRVGPFCLSASGKYPSWKLRVGYPP